MDAVGKKRKRSADIQRSVALRRTLPAGMVDGVVACKNDLGDGDEGVTILQERFLLIIYRHRTDPGASRSGSTCFKKRVNKCRRGAGWLRLTQTGQRDKLCGRGYTLKNKYCSGFCGKCATLPWWLGHAFLFAEQGNQVQNLNTAFSTYAPCCKHKAGFLSAKAGHWPLWLGRREVRADEMSECASQKTYKTVTPVLWDGAVSEP